ncbi:aldehyde dehydrogenase family protein [Microbacterium sp. C7(2022)]|uniref:aldehyde dehydrogenase family protein n=1 Tax=Microbacterium sp. C7(2022) TaxID=2992759 RepID=UPI00237A185F|nr:aldehyde dehydrogenase family protein [Microbacterium sp. C7(2022)]MDE0545156.1 aldehyde dehydrogenase family protein [Microbacterium sp. C7(2022)]
MSQVAPKSPASVRGTKKPRAKAAALPDDVTRTLDAAFDRLDTGAQMWSHLTLRQRASLMKALHSSVSSVAEEWADIAATSKDLAPGSPLRGEEWLSGPYNALTAIDAYRRTLEAMAAGRSPVEKVKMDAAPGGRTRAHVFPLQPIDGILLSGFTGEVWFEPGVTPDDVRREAGLAQRTPGESGGIGLVLGAGNVTAIPVLDVLYELLAHNRVSLLKVNPTQDALVPVFERALAPLIAPGFLQIVTGGGDVGAHLVTHPRVTHVHITGAATTFDAIVWGPSSGPAAGATTRRKRENRPKLTLPITAELGGVSPIIVVPGQWSDADLAFQAEHIATMRLQNSGHNCIAGQVVILSADWPQREAFLAALRSAYDAAPHRSSWYPQSTKKLEGAASDYPDAQWCAGGTRALVDLSDGGNAEALETTEYFSPVLGVVSLPGEGQKFLDAAVQRANERLFGTLGANVLIDPVTQSRLGGGFERAIADLRYGTIAVNAWTAVGFSTPTLTWGAFPGATLDDVSSGLGVVHNALLLDRVERSVVRGPFRPFPRSAGALLGSGTPSVLPKPPWFVTARTGASVSEGLTRFRMTGSVPGLVKTLARAFGA